MVVDYTGFLHENESSILDWITINENAGRNEAQNDIIPDINFFLCAKHENRGKIESHLWFFKGF